MDRKDDLQNWLLLGLLTLIWGTSYILIKKALVVFSPVQVAAARVSISFLACIPFYIPALRAIPRGKYHHLLFLGVIGIFVPAFLFAYSQTRINSERDHQLIIAAIHRTDRPRDLACTDTGNEGGRSTHRSIGCYRVSFWQERF